VGSPPFGTGGRGYEGESQGSERASVNTNNLRINGVTGKLEESKR
jgi:hypothetical protein